jgi:hypothetical protein
MPPEGADLVLPTDIPYGEGDVLIFDGLDVETLSKPRKSLYLNGWTPKETDEPIVGIVVTISPSLSL